MRGWGGVAGQAGKGHLAACALQSATTPTRLSEGHTTLPEAPCDTAANRPGQAAWWGGGGALGPRSLNQLALGKAAAGGQLPLLEIVEEASQNAGISGKSPLLASAWDCGFLGASVPRGGKVS